MEGNKLTTKIIGTMTTRTENAIFNERLLDRRNIIPLVRNWIISNKINMYATDVFAFMIPSIVWQRVSINVLFIPSVSKSHIILFNLWGTIIIFKRSPRTGYLTSTFRKSGFLSLSPTIPRLESQNLKKLYYEQIRCQSMKIRNESR